MKGKYYHPALEHTEENDGSGFVITEMKREICPSCNGYGTHFRSDLDEDLLVRSMEDDGDYEGIESYHQGSYDEICHQCKGQKVVDVPITLPEWAQKEIASWNECEREERKIKAMQARGIQI